MVIWTERAKKHITDFIDNARSGTGKVAKEYMLKLVSYTNILDNMNYLGTKLDKKIYLDSVRQLVYKSHRIIYTIENEQVYIVAVISTKIDFKNYIKKNLM